MTQALLNTKVSILKDKLMRYTSYLADMNQRKDPAAEDTKHRHRFLLNVVSALDGYLLTTDTLTENEILYTLELGICATQAYSL